MQELTYDFVYPARPTYDFVFERENCVHLQNLARMCKIRVKYVQKIKEIQKKQVPNPKIFACGATITINRIIIHYIGYKKRRPKGGDFFWQKVVYIAKPLKTTLVSIPPQTIDVAARRAARKNWGVPV